MYNIDNYYLDYKEEYIQKDIKHFEVVSPVSSDIDVDIVSGNDKDDLDIDGLKLLFQDVADYENPLDSDEDNHYDIGLKFKDSKDNFYIAYKSVNVEDRKYLRVNEKVSSDIADYDNFGNSIDISGSYVVVGASKDDDNDDGSGSAYLFKESDGEIKQIAKIKADDGEADDNFGSSVAIYEKYIAIGAPNEDTGKSNAGSVYIYKRDGSDVTQITKLQADDKSSEAHFGSSVAFYNNYLVVGAYNENKEGAVYIFKKDDNDNFDQKAKLEGSNEEENDKFGYSVSIDGKKVVVGVPGDNSNKGRAYLYKIVENDDGSFKEVDKLDDFNGNDTDDDDYFGYSVSIDNGYIVVGAYKKDDLGASYLFKIEDDKAKQKAKLEADNKSKDSLFGNSVAIYHDDIIIGAKNSKDIGAIYFFKRKSDDDIVQVERFNLNNPQRGDMLGSGVAIFSDRVVVGVQNRSKDSKHGGSFLMFKKDSNEE